jgi:phosphoribosyl 1,2-cyclic phosphate phosphodiesterase
MKITILGSGGAGGVPMVSVGWGACNPDNPKNRRLRPSILVETSAKNSERDKKIILIDTSPDLRQQLLNHHIRSLDAVLYTHDHADHVHGIDDLRELNRLMQRPIPVYGEEFVLKEIESRFSYIFKNFNFDGRPIHKPTMTLHPIKDDFMIGSQKIQSFEQGHGFCKTTGYRFDRFAFSTDIVEIPLASEPYLYDLDLWIVGCLMTSPHPTHAHLEKVIGWVEKYRPKKTILTHMGPKLDYDVLKKTLPDHIEPAYDGMVIDII